MRAWSLWLGIAGAVLSVAAAVWLLVGFRPDDDRYTHSMLYPGRSVHEGLQRLLRDQSRVAAVAVSGATLTLLGLVLGVLA